MSFRAKDYPKDWKEVSRYIRTERSGGRCECDGECGVGHEPRRCIERNGNYAVYAKGKVILTTAHLNRSDGICKCDPKCSNPAHLKAMCQRCHLRYDGERHRANSALSWAERKAKAEKKQGRLFG